jgi:hypothetical protein
VPNRDFDTGKPTQAYEYKLADQTYAALVERLAANQFAQTTPGLRANILAFYEGLQSPKPNDIPPSERQKVESALADLRQMSPAQ